MTVIKYFDRPIYPFVIDKYPLHCTAQQKIGERGTLLAGLTRFNMLF